MKSRPSSAVVVSALCSLWCGLALAGCVTSHLLPLTVSRFTENAAVIGMILALHPLMGLLVSPLAGRLGDRRLGRHGGRLVIALVAAPVVALCLVGIPHAMLLWQLIVLIAVYQFLHDSLWASSHPLVFLLGGRGRKTLITGVLMMSAQAVGWVFAKYGMRWLAEPGGEARLYATAAVLQAVLIAVPIWVLLAGRDLPAEPRPEARHRAGAGLWRLAVVRRIGVAAFCECSCRQLLHTYYILFAVKTLALSPTEFGEVWSLAALASFSLAIPSGLLADSWISKQRILTVGYACLCGASIAGWMAESAAGLSFSVLIFGVGRAITTTAQRPLLNDYVPPEISGEANGYFSAFLSFGRIVATLVAGVLVHGLDDNYRYVFILCLALSLVSALLMLTLPGRADGANRGAPIQPVGTTDQSAGIVTGGPAVPAGRKVGPS